MNHPPRARTRPPTVYNCMSPSNGYCRGLPGRLVLYRDHR